MMERASHLVDHVFPADVPVRQWMLSVPHRLRYRLSTSALTHPLARESRSRLARRAQAVSVSRRRARRGASWRLGLGTRSGYDNFPGCRSYSPT
jgi:hypothetical protein